MPASNPFEAAKAKSNRSINRLIALILVVVLGFCALCVAILREARKEAWERAGKDPAPETFMDTNAHDMRGLPVWEIDRWTVV